MTQYFIYKLACDDCDFIYVGSTRSIKDRKRAHKNKSKTSETKIYQMIREYGGWENWRMVILEECDENVETKRQAEMREETFRLQLNADLNSRRAYRSEEVNQANDKERKSTPEYKAYIKEYLKEYNQRPENKAHRKEYEQRPENKARKKEYEQRPENKAHRKEYDKERKSTLEYKEYRKEYEQRPEVKERINAQRRERYRLKKEAKQKASEEYTPSSPTFTSSSDQHSDISHLSLDKLEI